MVQEIDFLSESYRQSRRRQQKSLWRRATLVAAVTIIAAATVQQRLSHSRLRENRDRLQAEATQMLAAFENVGVLKNAHQHLDTRANLVANLNVCVHPTRILYDTVNNLPRFVQITKFELTHNIRSQRNSNAPRIRKRPDNQKISETSDAATDLGQLIQNRKDRSLIVSLSGIAPDDVSIAQYLATLERAGTFDRVRLLFTDRHRVRNEPLRKFGIELRVRKPGEGLLKNQVTRRFDEFGRVMSSVSLPQRPPENATQVVARPDVQNGRPQ